MALSGSPGSDAALEAVTTSGCSNARSMTVSTVTATEIRSANQLITRMPVGDFLTVIIVLKRFLGNIEADTSHVNFSTSDAHGNDLSYPAGERTPADAFAHSDQVKPYPAEASQVIFEYIEGFYNSQRWHSGARPSESGGRVSFSTPQHDPKYDIRIAFCKTRGSGLKLQQQRDTV